MEDGSVGKVYDGALVVGCGCGAADFKFQHFVVDSSAGEDAGAVHGEDSAVREGYHLRFSGGGGGGDLGSVGEDLSGDDGGEDLGAGREDGDGVSGEGEVASECHCGCDGWEDDLGSGRHCDGGGGGDGEGLRERGGDGVLGVGLGASGDGERAAQGGASGRGEGHHLTREAGCHCQGEVYACGGVSVDGA